jgi:16S rRNA processing protein RimM
MCLEVEDFDICIGVIAAANGIKGYVKIKCFAADPKDIENFKEVIDVHSKRVFAIKVIGVRGDCVIASIAGVTSRNDAEKLQNIKLYIKRSELPTPSEGEFYHADLVGCQVRLGSGMVIGEIKDVHNFGAGDLIEVHDFASNKDIYHPFNKDFVQEVNLAERFVILSPIDESINVAESYIIK